MEFWGVEVKAGQTLKVKPDIEKILHLSQVVLGEGKKDKANESATITLKIGDQKLILGILSPDKFPQLSYDLVFEKEFELSHNWKNGSLHFCGYQTYISEGGEDFYDSDDSSEEEEEPLPIKSTENGIPAPKVEESKKLTAKADGSVKAESSDKQKVKLVEPSKNKDDEDDQSGDEDDESDEDDEDGDSDEDMDDAQSDDDEDDESDEEDDEETPKKVIQGKKRPNEAAAKTPVSGKKAKSDITPQKTDGKKGGHTATPHPAKKAGKSPNSAKTPKSADHSCGSCKKSFNSDVALKSHNKAKHGGN